MRARSTSELGVYHRVLVGADVHLRHGHRAQAAVLLQNGRFARSRVGLEILQGGHIVVLAQARIFDSLCTPKIANKQFTPVHSGYNLQISKRAHSVQKRSSCADDVGLGRSGWIG